jgi:hypothetical protein
MGVPPVLAGGHPDRCKLLPAGRQQPGTAGTAVFRSMNMRFRNQLRTPQLDAKIREAFASALRERP